MPGPRTSPETRAATARRLLAELPAAPWGDAERTAIRKFARVVATDAALDVVYRYLHLVEELGRAHGAGASLRTTEGGRLLVGLDANAYRGLPIGELQNPVEWIDRHLATPTGRKRFGPRLERWIESLPDRLARLAAVTTRGSPPLDFGQELFDLVAAHARTGAARVPPAIEAACDAFRQGRTSTVEIPMAATFAFYWPKTVSAWPELMIAKEAVRFLKSIGCPKCERSLRDIAVDLPEIRRGTKYHRDTLERYARQGLLKRKSRKQK